MLSAFAAEPQAGIDFSQKLLGPGNQILLSENKPDAAPITLKFVVSQVLYATLKDDIPDRKRDHDMAALAERINNSKEKYLLLTNEENKLILDRLYKVFPRITAYAAECILDRAACKK